jgi:hypothetical protein
VGKWLLWGCSASHTRPTRLATSPASSSTSSSTATGIASVAAPEGASVDDDNDAWSAASARRPLPAPVSEVYVTKFCIPHCWLRLSALMGATPRRAEARLMRSATPAPVWSSRFAGPSAIISASEKKIAVPSASFE